MSEKITAESLNKFIDYLDELADQVRKTQETEELRRLPLPDYLYHATKKSNLARIQLFGLKPSKLIFSPDEVVSLSDEIGFALRVAKETQQVQNPNDLVVLKIDTLHLAPSAVRNYLRLADLSKSDPKEAAAIHEVHYERVIDPTAMSVEVVGKKEKMEMLVER